MRGADTVETRKVFTNFFLMSTVSLKWRAICVSLEEEKRSYDATNV